VKIDYPKVLGEFETLDLILQGWSIGRLGDGEANLLRGRKNVSQIAVPALTTEMREFVAAPPKGCLVGLPTLDPRCPRLENWKRYEPVFAPFTNSKVKYGSAFITRPDNAPWIDVPEFYDKVESLWRDQEVTLVGNGERSFTKEWLEERGARVHWVKCSYRDSYAQIDRLEQECLAAGRRAILACGPTATVLAGRLARQKVHTIDLGHLAMLWRRYDNPKTVKREINKQTGKLEPN
jgi:hypothetical protein